MSKRTSRQIVIICLSIVIAQKVGFGRLHFKELLVRLKGKHYPTKLSKDFVKAKTKSKYARRMINAQSNYAIPTSYHEKYIRLSDIT